MGWTDSHLHQFEKDGKVWRLSESSEFDDDIEITSESRVPIGKVLVTEGDFLIYFVRLWRRLAA